MAKIFISYAGLDRDEVDCLLPRVERILPTVRECLLELWEFRTGLVAGQPVDREIQRQLRSSDLVVVMVSYDWLKSRYSIEGELHRAIGLGIPVLPVQLKRVGRNRDRGAVGELWMFGEDRAYEEIVDKPGRNAFADGLVSEVVRLLENGAAAA